MSVKLFEQYLNESKIPVVTTDMLSWNKDTQTFSRYVSDLRGILSGGEKEIYVKNIKTDKSVLFTFTKPDTDGEDIFGWNYVNKEMGLNLLIIND
jgi:hypothetical protein